MENLFTKASIILARLLVVGFFTLAIVSPLFMLFYLIIFQNLELLNEISIKCYGVSYFIGFVINYLYIVRNIKNDEKPINKGFQR